MESREDVVKYAILKTDAPNSLFCYFPERKKIFRALDDLPRVDTGDYSSLEAKVDAEALNAELKFAEEIYKMLKDAEHPEEFHTLKLEMDGRTVTNMELDRLDKASFNQLIILIDQYAQVRDELHSSFFY